VVALQGIGVTGGREVVLRQATHAREARAMRKREGIRIGRNITAQAAVAIVQGEEEVAVVVEVKEEGAIAEMIEEIEQAHIIRIRDMTVEKEEDIKMIDIENGQDLGESKIF
jgi:hypothetical protein